MKYIENKIAKNIGLLLKAKLFLNRIFQLCKLCQCCLGKYLHAEFEKLEKHKQTTKICS